jgi:hypothetical protein
VEDFDGYVPEDQGAVASLENLITYDPAGDPLETSTHFAAVPAQACARCHLWSRGKGYRGAVGKDGTYRADGCAACHMLYSNDGRSQSGDPTIDHAEQGHPMHHVVTKAIPTEQCLHCHHRGARIGLSFTGRAQMPPRLPSGPGVTGTTDVQFNNNYHYVDPETNPPDIHGELGLDCIDCHTRNEVMGDGNIWGHMDQATKIECRTCHGMPDSEGTLVDNDGHGLWNVTNAGGSVRLISKVDGQYHEVTQIMDLVDPLSNDHNPRAACAMDDNHLRKEGGLECYACHSYWTPNCFGCHFERDERFEGVNLVTRQSEVGRVRTNNKVFESLKQFFMGPNSEGRIAPYIVSCHPIAEVIGPDGEVIRDFAMPSASNDLSGLGYNPVHPHTIRGRDEVRTCAECHRAPSALGLGTGNYALARTYAFATAVDGVHVFDRWTDPTDPAYVATLDVPNPLAIASWPDVVEGTVDYLYVAAGEAGLYAFNLCCGLPSSPVNIINDVNAIDVSRAANYIYVVEEGFGVRIYDDDPESFQLVASVAIPGALRAVPWGIHLFVAAGEDGLAVIDISDHTAPNVVGIMAGVNAVDVRPYAHFRKSRHFAARLYVADPDYGVHVVDLLPDFDAPLLLSGLQLPGALGLDTYSRYLPADDLVPSREHDYLYVAAGDAGLHVFDITDPDEISEVASLADLGGPAMHVDVASAMTPPGTDDYALVANGVLGVQMIDVTDPLNPELLATADATGAGRVFFEVQQMDRFIDEQGQLLKENSHPGIYPFTRADIVRLLTADITTDCTMPFDFDGDWEVDWTDYAHFEACFTGSGGEAAPSCALADSDLDGDVDCMDWAQFRFLWTEPPEDLPDFPVCICAADFDDDGEVRAADLAQLLGAWGPNPDHPADLDGDGTVDASDLAILLAAWGPCA